MAGPLLRINQVMSLIITSPSQANTDNWNWLAALRKCATRARQESATDKYAKSRLLYKVDAVGVIRCSLTVGLNMHQPSNELSMARRTNVGQSRFEGVENHR